MAVAVVGREGRPASLDPEWDKVNKRMQFTNCCLGVYGMCVCVRGGGGDLEPFLMVKFLLWLQYANLAATGDLQQKCET